jgi:hypothetical protein
MVGIKKAYLSVWKKKAPIAQDRCYAPALSDELPASARLSIVDDFLIVKFNDSNKNAIRIRNCQAEYGTHS